MILGAAAVAGLIGVLILVGLYFLPTIIGGSRKVVNVGSVFAINLLLGWTLIGWAVAFAMAVRTNPPHAYREYWRQMGPTAAGPSGPPAGWYRDPGSGPDQRWWDGTKWTEHTKPN